MAAGAEGAAGRRARRGSEAVLGEDHLFLARADAKGLTAAEWTGGAWKTESLASDTIGSSILTASGNAVYCFYVQVETDTAGKTVNAIRYRRWKDGAWQPAVTVAVETAAVNVLAAPVRCPPEYVAVFWGPALEKRVRARSRGCDSRAFPIVEWTNVMPANVEVKARLRDLAAAQAIAERLAGSRGEIGDSRTFSSRRPGQALKVRTLAPDCGEDVIQYDRMNATGPRLSRYEIVPTFDPAGLANLLTAALGVVGVVRKTRRLFLVGQTRIHLDDVEGLGYFVEVEVVLRPGQSPIDGQRIAGKLLGELGVQDSDLVPEAYIDLVLKKDGAKKE